MKKTIQFCIIIFAMTISFNALSQRNNVLIDSGSINDQFDYLIEKSSRWEQYRVIRISWLNEMSERLKDSVNEMKASERTLMTRIDEQEKEISRLNQELNSNELTNQRLVSETKSISLFGTLYSKSTFKTVLFSIIGILLALVLLYLAKFRRSISVTKETLLRLKETEEEFDEHRRIALEREQKVRRQLQDELNKQKKE